MRAQIERLLRVEEGRKLEVYQATFESAELFNLNYWLELFLAAGIATLGLVQNSTAVIIGAMLVSPLMGPIIAAGLALALGDFYLGLKAVLNVVISVVAAVVFAAGLVWALPFQSATSEILARTQPNLLDLGVAIFSGLAGSIVACRGGQGGGVTALPGVAIAVALMPPLCVVGFGIGSGWNWTIVGGGGLLFLTNLVAIVASAFLVFFVVRMDAPEIRTRINEWARGREETERLYTLMLHSALRPLLGHIGSMPRRAMILVVFLLTIFVPLRSGLERVRDETTARAAVRDEIRRAFSPESVVFQHVEVSREAVRIHLVCTESVPAEKKEELRQIIAGRTGKAVTLIMQEVARKEDVAALGQQIARPPLTVPQLETVRKELLVMVDAALGSAWPATTAPLAGYSLNLKPETLEIQVAYLSDSPIEGPGEEAVRRAVESRLGARVDWRLERLDPKVELFRWRAGLLQPPAAAQQALGRVAELLTRYPRLSSRILLPAKAAPELEASLSAALPERIRVERTESASPVVVALVESTKR